MVEKVQKGGGNKPQKKRQMFIELSGKNIAITTFNLRAATEALHMLECIFVIVRFLSLTGFDQTANQLSNHHRGYTFVATKVVIVRKRRHSIYLDFLSYCVLQVGIFCGFDKKASFIL